MSNFDLLLKKTSFEYLPSFLGMVLLMGAVNRYPYWVLPFLLLYTVFSCIEHLPPLNTTCIHLALPSLYLGTALLPRAPRSVGHHTPLDTSLPSLGHCPAFTWAPPSHPLDIALPSLRHCPPSLDPAFSWHTHYSRFSAEFKSSLPMPPFSSEAPFGLSNVINFIFLTFMYRLQLRDHWCAPPEIHSSFCSSVWKLFQNSLHISMASLICYPNFILSLLARCTWSLQIIEHIPCR